MIDNKLLRKYATLIVRTGANVQQGQGVVIHGAVEQHEFIECLTEEAYKAGAKWVTVEWGSQKLTKLHYQHQTLESLSEVPQWREEKMQYWVDENPCRIHILSEDPDGLNGVDREKMQQSQISVYKVLKKYRDAMENKYQWTIAAVPSLEWAQKVFPELTDEEAVRKLWKAILQTVYVTEEQDAMEAWKLHNENFKEKCRKLNEYAFERLEYKSSNGTDFQVWLIPEAQWLGGGETALNGVYFNPNMPTEEIFTSPMKGKAEGRVVATKPLSYQGQIIENFSMVFQEGRVISCEAEKGQDLLEKMIAMDENAAFLGEVALIPYDSPINNTGLLFYETLFDENASCHIALGSGFSNTLRGFENMTKEETRALGINDSIIHVDFMIGAEDLNIKGYCKDGSWVEVFRNGNWAF